MTLLNLDAQFASRIDHRKTLDRLGAGIEGAPNVARPDLAGLRQVIEATEAAPSADFNAWRWTHNGIGQFIAANPIDSLKMDSRPNPQTGIAGMAPQLGSLTDYNAVASRFRLTTDDVAHLFCNDEVAEPMGSDARRAFVEKLDQFIVDHQESSECRACSEIFYVDPEKAADAMYCPTCEKKHAEQD